MPAAAAPALAFALAFGTAAPGTGTTLSLQLRYGTPPAKPPAVERVAIALPAGTRLGLDLPFPCTASDLALLLKGSGECPDASRVGTGAFDVHPGLGLGPFPGTAEVFRTPTGLVEVARINGLALGVDRFRAEGTTLVATPPALPGGPPDFRTTFGRLDDRLVAPDFVTTPRACPRRGFWRATARVRFAGGADVVREAELKCAAPRTKKARKPNSHRRSRSITQPMVRSLP